MICFTKKPRVVKICGHDVPVRYRKRLKDYGQFHYDDLKIYIRSDEKWREHLLHEILHGIIHLSGQKERLEDDHEEALVVALENGLKSLIFS